MLKIRGRARESARDSIKRIKAGLPAVEPPKPKPDAFKSVAENWLKRHVIAKRLRTRGEIERVLEKYVYPLWGNRDFTSLRRSDIAALLDHVEDHHGARQADYVLAIVRQSPIGTARGTTTICRPSRAACAAPRPTSASAFSRR